MALDIALPFHGDVGLFKEAVKSVLNQDSAEWRLIVVNDAHPDFKVDDWIKDLNEPRITYIRNETNLGPSKNYSKCLELIENEHCMIFGADDILAQNFVSQMLKAIQSTPNSEIYHPLVKVIDASGQEYLPQVDRIKRLLMPKANGLKVYSVREVMPSLMTGNWMYFPAIVWKSKCIKKFGFRHDLNVCQDLWLISKILMEGGLLVIVPEQIFKYRRFKESDSTVKLVNGIRFNEEKSTYYELARILRSRRYFKESVLAFLHITSRLHALTLMTKVKTDVINITRILKHIVT